jgi:azurin
VRARFLVAAVAAGAVIAGTAQQLTADQAKPAPVPARLVALSAGDPVGEKMSYSMNTIKAKPGERLKLRLVSLGQLPRTVMTHNWVLLALGADPKKFADAAAMSPKTGYIPAALKSQIVAMTEMVGPGEQSEIVFTVPSKPGTYPFLCTFAGHFVAGMAGTLIVK